MTLAWGGKYIEVHVDGTWEYVKRARDIDAAVILATTQADDVVLVEQYRPALKRRSLELPAGLIGDETIGELPLASAQRELLEETGFASADWSEIGAFASSPGMVGETFRLFRARDCRRMDTGGGVAGEAITVHVVPIPTAPDAIASARARGCAIDTRLLVLLRLL